jgi:predicted nucleic acid-binding protein
MSDRYFVDTNILMYAHDAASGEKHEKAKALVEKLWETRSGVVSTQVLQELAVNLRRKARKPLDARSTRDVVSDYLTWQVVVNGGDSILEALDIEARYQVSFWDALVIQAAQAGGAETLYSEDLSDGQHYGGVRVSNPFKASGSTPVQRDRDE